MHIRLSASYLAITRAANSQPHAGLHWNDDRRVRGVHCFYGNIAALRLYPAA